MEERVVFYIDSLKRFIPNGQNASILVVAGGKNDVIALKQCEFNNVLITNITENPINPVEPYNYQKADALSLGVEVGSPAFYEPRFTKLANNRVSATSVDDRAGCAVLVKLAERLSTNKPDVNIYIVGSVQEEFNLRGALVAAQQIKPNAAISIDLAVATDTPDMQGVNELALDKGPIVGLYTFHGRGTLNGLIPHPKMVKIVETSATKLKMNLQRHASVGMLTDASYVQFVDNGIPCIDLAWPTRYTHSGIETFSLNDLENLEALVFGVIKDFPVDFSGSRL
jgi:putative aminopeptidase FrvX